MNDKPIAVLLIEDNPGDTRLIREMLKEAGAAQFELACADRLLAGLERLAEGDIDVILLDLGLPDSQGLDTLGRVLAEPPGAHVIVVLTGLDDESLAIQAVREGAQDYLVKGQVDGNLLGRAMHYAIERQRAEESLRESEERYRSVVEHSHAGILIVDDAYRFVYVNDELCRILGYSSEEIVGQDFRTFLDDESKQLVADRYARRQRGEKVPPHYEFSIVRKDGEKRRVEVRSAVIKDSAGKVKTVGQILDITERKRADKALRESEERFRVVMKGSPLIVAITNRELRYVWIQNPHPDFDSEAMIGKRDDELADNEGTQQLMQLKQQVIKREVGTRTEITFPLSTGSLTYDMTAEPLRDTSGRVIGVTTVALDITERKRAEEALRVSEERFALAVRGSDAGLWDWDIRNNSLYWSPRLKELLGHAADELEADFHTFKSHLHPDDREHTGAAIEAHLKDRGMYDVEQRLRTKSGAYRWFHARGQARWDEAGNPVRMVGFLTDITERRQAEEALRASEEKHRTILENIEDGYYEVDLAGNLTFFNDSLCRLYGYSEDELMGMNNRQYMDDETAKIVYQAFNAVYRTRKPARAFDWELIRKDGTRSFVDVSVSLIRSSTGEPTGFRGIVRDITERKRAEEEIRRHLERIEALREIDRAITSTLDLTGVLDIILEELEGVIPYHSAGIFLFSEGIARLAAGRGFPDMEHALQVSFSVKEDPLIRKLLQEERPLVLADAQADQRFLARGGTEYVRSWMGVPLIARGRVVGFLTIDHREPGVYDEENAEIVQAFASQVAIAIENAWLYEETQRELAERKQAEEELRQSFGKLRRALEGTITTLASVIEIKDPYTAGHQQRTTQLACAIAREMGLPDEQIEGLRMAALIHDLGKISIPAEVLSNPNPLSDFQWNLIKAHPQIGYDILKAIEFPWPVAETVLQHHERLDGSGYPQGLSSRDILMKAKVLAVADVVEAMASFRPYRPARGIDEALEEISQNRGILYDPEVVGACLKLFTEKGFEFE